MELDWKTDQIQHAQNIESYLRTKYGYAKLEKTQLSQNYLDALFVGRMISNGLRMEAQRRNEDTTNVVPEEWTKNDTFAMADTAFAMLKLARQKIVTSSNFEALPANIKDMLPDVSLFESPEHLVVGYIDAYIPHNIEPIREALAKDIFAMRTLPCIDGNVMTAADLIDEADLLRHQKPNQGLFRGRF